MQYHWLPFPGEAGENCISLPAAVRPDPGQHASILPPGSLPHLLHFKWSSKSWWCSYDNGDSSQHNLRSISVTLGKHHDFKPCHFNNKTSPLISLVKHELYIRFLSLFLPQTDFCTILCSTNSSVVLICQVCCDLLDATDVVSAMVDYNGTLNVYFHCEIGMDAVVKLCLKFWQSLQLVNKMEAGDESFLFSPPSAPLPGLPWWPQCGRRGDFCNTPRQLGRCLLFQRSTQLHHR